MTYGSTVELSGDFSEVVEQVRAALAAQGFGILTEIDVKATMKAKLDADLSPYLILGACNPQLAMQALEADPSLGLLLPCNVIVRVDGDMTVVEAVDPMIMVGLSSGEDLVAVAKEASVRLDSALDALDLTAAPAERHRDQAARSRSAN